MHSELESIGRLVSVAERAVTRRLQRHFREAGYSITVEQWRVLFYLWIEDGQTQKFLSEKVARDKTSISRLINGLERKNLVVRIVDASNKRNNQIYLTHLGKSLKEKLIPMSYETVEQAQDGIPQDKIALCKEVLHQLIDNLIK